jgi:hypothetical protein
MTDHKPIREQHMRWKTFVLTVGLAIAGLAGCAPQQPPAPPPQPVAATCPAVFQPALVPQWMTCADGKANINWPPNEGFEAPPTVKILHPGTLIDRFGSENGNFFSPKGASYASRAVPYICEKMDYRVYRVRKPIKVKAGKAAPWFNEPGEATQYETTDNAAKLLADHALSPVTFRPAGTTPAPQCGMP